MSTGTTTSQPSIEVQNINTFSSSNVVNPYYGNFLEPIPPEVLEMRKVILKNRTENILKQREQVDFTNIANPGGANVYYPNYQPTNTSYKYSIGGYIRYNDAYSRNICKTFDYMY